ncbi:hypothetical protein NG99_25050 [Erwinia typographi]|uniref:Uncharacterized protein n=2 Tax=Erwinia typographi TaxID=371042 RepID=A0A0A3YMD3_9GAMM|nr:hypothetical protein NG99_25050 [Erwinia typographi]
MNGLNKTYSLTGICAMAILWSSFALAEEVTLTLSQEQDGGEAGRACMYIHEGKAEYRIVQSHESCPATVVVQKNNNHT